MIFTTNTLQSTAIWMSIDDRDLSTIPHRTYSNPTAQNNTELNQLCLDKTQAWLTEIGIESTPSFTAMQMAAMWDVVNGCALTIGNRRLILIPSDKLDREEFRVPQEWVDIPAWMGDYYLAVQIDLDDLTLNIWGYTSHKTLRETATYHQIDRTYSLDGDFLIPELDILWMAQLLDLQEIAIVPPIPQLNVDRSISAIDLLSQPSPYSPRLNLDFNTWAAIISNNGLREQLYQRRLQAANIQVNPVVALNLSDWLMSEFNRAIEQGWDSINNIIMGEQLATVRSIRTRGEMSIERAKLINLQYQLSQTTVLMSIGISPQDVEYVVISVQINPAPGMSVLPPQLKLSYLTDEGEELQSVISRSQDFQIQLPTFTCDVGTSFNIQLELDGVSQIERFIA